MNLQPLFRIGVVLGVVALGFAMCFASYSTQEKGDKTVNALLTERRAVLLQLVQHLQNRHKRGLIKIDEVYRAQNELLAAELELATTKDERIAALESRVANFELIEKRAIELQKVGAVGGEVEVVLTATATRLQAEIQLLREKAKEE